MVVRISQNRISLEDARLERSTMKDFGYITQYITSTASTTINIANGNVVKLYHTTNITTLSVTNPSPAGTLCRLLIVRIKDNTSTARTITWPTSFKWNGGSAPTLSTGASSVDIIEATTFNGGASWMATATSQNFSSTASLFRQGYNINGEIGDGTKSDRSSPTQVGTLATWTKVYGGNSGCFAIKTDGTLWANGAAAYGFLGYNSVSYVSSPTQVGTISDWSTMSSGTWYSIALRTGGSLWSWGYAHVGQLGDNSVVNKSVPVQVGTISTWTSVAATSNYTAAAIQGDGSLWTWGYGLYGELGTNSTTPRSSPVQVGTLLDWQTVVPGYSHFLAKKTDGTIWSWGYNASGQLGDATIVNKSSPVQIGTLATWSSVSGGISNSAAIKTDGTLWIWGVNTHGEIGDGTWTAKTSPIQLGSGTDWVTVDLAWSGARTCLAKKRDGSVWGWGWNSANQFAARGGMEYSPIQIGTMNDWQSPVPGPAYLELFARKTDGSLWGCGYNQYGNLGQNDAVNRSSPVQITSWTDWTNLCAGWNVVFGIRNSGQLWGWGRNDYGSVGDGTAVHRTSPVQIGTLATWSNVFTGYVRTLAVRTDGSLWSWGLNDAYGSLGLNDVSVNRSSPTQIGTLLTWASGKCRDMNGMARQTDGSLWAWGYNGWKVVDNTGTNRSSPVQIGTLKVWADYSVGNYFALAVQTDGSLWTWGYNPYGNLGTNNITSYDSPVQVGTMKDWATVYAGNYVSYARKTTGTIWSWGYSYGGELGNSTENTSSPVQIGTLATWTVMNAAGNYQAHAVKNDGTLWGWGNSHYGQLGNNWDATYASPVQVGTRPCLEISAGANEISLIVEV